MFLGRTEGHRRSGMNVQGAGFTERGSHKRGRREGEIWQPHNNYAPLCPAHINDFELLFKSLLTRLHSHLQCTYNGGLV
uniref:Uncharacterized protein n=1 Tax=Anguilla anguilla TaxID=7936 RepID=A0A0E9XX22_ANGAN